MLLLLLFLFLSLLRVYINNDNVVVFMDVVVGAVAGDAIFVIVVRVRI